MTCCFILGGLVGLLIATVVVALILCSKPLMDVHIKDIQNVLALEQELMLDIHVHAVNPNLVAIQVSELDVYLLAKSKYVGSGTPSTARKISDSEGKRGYDLTLERKGYGGIASPTGAFNDHTRTNGVDEGNDPIDEPGTDPHTLLLGQIFDFDSPLIFDASPLRHLPLSSIGEVRMANPGNSTAQGNEQWRRVVEHPFELLVRGFIRYTLPISSKVREAAIRGSVTVRPEAPSDDTDDWMGVDHELRKTSTPPRATEDGQRSITTVS